MKYYIYISLFTTRKVGRMVERSRPREKKREMGKGGRENSNWKTSILEDSSVRSIGTYPTASPCYTTNTNKCDNTTSKYYKHD